MSKWQAWSSIYANNFFQMGIDDSRYYIATIGRRQIDDNKKLQVKKFQNPSLKSNEIPKSLIYMRPDLIDDFVFYHKKTVVHWKWKVVSNVTR